jgi:hypothetical protein
MSGSEGASEREFALVCVANKLTAENEKFRLNLWVSMS